MVPFIAIQRAKRPQSTTGRDLVGAPIEHGELPAEAEMAPSDRGGQVTGELEPVA